MSGTPRSGRTKKKSTLSRLALKAGTNPHESEDSEQESVPYSSRRSTSRDDLADSLHRQRLGTDSRYPIDADVSVSRNNQYRSDSDEGIELNTGSSGFNSTGRRQLPEIPRRHTSTLQTRIQTDSDEDDDDDDDDGYVDRSQVQGEKRYRDQNSDGDDLRLRNRKEPPWKPSPLERGNRTEPMDIDSPRARPKSRLGYDNDRGNTGRYGQTNDISDEDDYYKQSSSLARSPDLTKRLSLRQPREDLTGLYKNALEQAERELSDDDGQSEHYEREDDLADLRRYSHSPPRPSARSPEHHDYNRQITSTSIASSITSRTFKNAAHKQDPFGNLSQASLQSTSVLPVISTKQARNRYVQFLSCYLYAYNLVLHALQL